MLGEHLDDYLRLRRGLGFRLVDAGRFLASFVAYLEARGATTVTVELAVSWARQPEGIKPISVDFRISAVRCFARYLHAIDPAHEVPPPGLLAVPRRRPAPYIYSPEQLAEVVTTAQQLEPRLRAMTCHALFGMLAATGMRVGEAVALSCAEVDLVDGLITVRHAKFDRVRLVPLAPSVTAELQRYATTRDRLCPTRHVDRFFVSVTGGDVSRHAAHRAFRETTERMGLRTDTVHPRLHDLRHSFAVHTLIDAHRRGMNVSSVLPVLSTYLGHVEPANTYWYLSGVPELMQLVADRLEQHQGGQS
jgi:integrase/recombinase XerD